ncbi:MAG: hypothetical protein WC209_02340 [Ignavibacteriaceae bacterium]|jgi:hypothetical protein
MKAPILSILFLQLFLSSCVSLNFNCDTQSSDNKIKQKLSINELAGEKYGDNFEIRENETKEFYLVLNRSKSATQTGIKFFIYEKAEHAIIWEDQVRLGSVKWAASYEVDVQNFPGTVRLNDTRTKKTGYLFNVKTKQKIND